MENNIFEGAKFGDKFKTKDGRCAVLVNRSQYGESVYCYVQESGMQFYGEERYNLDGTALECNCSHDIIGRWKEEKVDIEDAVTWILHNWWDYGNRHRFVDAFREHWKKHDEA